MKRTRGGAEKNPTPISPELKEELEVYERFFFQKYESEAVKQGLRHDGRSTADTRQFAVDGNVVPKSLGSALVTQGGSRVLCATRVGCIPPVGEDADEGRLEIRCTIPSVAAEGVNYDFLKYQQLGHSIAQYVKKMIDACGMVDTRQLCVEKKVCALNLHVDVYVLNCDGSLRDACLHAAVCALLRSSIPTIELEDGLPVPVVGKDKKLAISHYPVSVTMGMFQGEILPDLTKEEEDMMTSFSVVHDSTSRLINVYKEGGKRLSEEGIKTAIDLAKGITKTLKTAMEATTSEQLTPGEPEKKRAKTSKKKGKLF